MHAMKQKKKKHGIIWPSEVQGGEGEGGGGRFDAKHPKHHKVFQSF